MSEASLPDLPEGLEPIRRLGRGSMARVYLARESELGRLVAVKILRPDLAADETARARFEREARSSASLSHPNVVAVHRFGRLEDDTPYLVMSYVKGRTLDERLKAQGPLPVDEARSVLASLASALDAAHRQGIVHRDVRPGNVLFEEETGRALLTDFGIAAVLDSGSSDGGRLTQTGQILGTPRYASPEQLSGEPITEQADVYSLAVTGYEALTGEGPYDARGTAQWITAHLTKEPRPLRTLRHDVDADLADLLLRCLAKEPSHRPRAGDVARELRTPPARSPGAGFATAATSEEPVDGFVGAFASVKRRRFLQFLAVGVGGAWMLIEATSLMVDDRVLPGAAKPVSYTLAAFVILATAVIAWYHGEKGRQEVPVSEMWILGGLAVLWLAVTTFVLLG